MKSAKLPKSKIYEVKLSIEQLIVLGYVVNAAKRALDVSPEEDGEYRSNGDFVVSLSPSEHKALMSLNI